MKKSLYLPALIVCAVYLTACSDSTPPPPQPAESQQTTAEQAEPTITQSVHDPLERAKSVSTLIDDAAEARRQQMQEQTQ
ncbi:MAG: hypothetical protein EPN21_11490 [Methylococcaceae bacterium]|nr:MAG: hypothetical protein EPN21_11490 [Methylococcaceae bacterium]